MEPEIVNAEKVMPPKENDEDRTEYPQYYGSPPSSPFNGFGV